MTKYPSCWGLWGPLLTGLCLAGLGVAPGAVAETDASATESETPAAFEASLVDGIAAQVDKRIVLVSEVMRSVRPREEAMRAAGAPESEIAKLRADGLEALIEARLLEELIERNEMEADEEEINRTIEGIAAENGLSIEQLYASVVFHGLSVENYRAQIKGDIERRNIVNAVVGGRVEIDPREIEAVYRSRFGDQPKGGEAVRVRQILRAFGGPEKRSRTRACREARDALARIRSGESFEAVASEVSDVAPRDGGDIGWLPLDSVAPWMRDALDDLQPGDVSELVELEFGCTLLNFVEQRSYEPVTFEQAQPALARELWERRLESEYRKWMEELRENAYIERRGFFGDSARVGAGLFSSGNAERARP